MAISCDRAKPGLEPETERRIREVFGGHVCCRCGQPAQRMRADAYYCHVHFIRAGGGGPDAPRVYRAATRVE